MAGKKEKKKIELTEAEKAMLDPEEVEALEAPDEEGTELGKEEGKEEVKEEVKKEEVVKEEVKEKVKEEVKEEIKEADVEIPEQTATLLKERDIPIQTKNGKHFIPFSELEKARKKAGEYKAENQELRIKIDNLSAKVDAFGPKPEVKPPAEIPPEIDKDEIERQIYDGEITPKEGLELVEKARAVAKAEAKPETEETKPVDPNEIAAQAVWQMKFDAGLAEIYKEYPALKDDKGLGNKAKRFGEAIIEDALDGKSKEEQMEWLADPDNVINAGRQAAKEVTESIPPKDSETFDSEAERKKIRQEESERITASLVDKFNLKPDEVKTLSDVGGTSSPASKKEELDAMSAEQLEEAMEGMSKQETDDYLDGKLD